MHQVSFRMTEDGSHTLFVPDLNEHYHSIHGAIHESDHVYIQAGFIPLASKQSLINILEVGFGTGLNALLTLNKADELNIEVRYTAIEPTPLDEKIWSELNYPEMIRGKNITDLFRLIHTSPWERWIYINSQYYLKKMNTTLQGFKIPDHLYHLVYFDAFAPAVQPELWSQEIFDKIFRMTQPGGKLVTYCCKGYVKRKMLNAGFEIEKLPGPQGKREMLRATKPIMS